MSTVLVPPSCMSMRKSFLWSQSAESLDVVTLLSLSATLNGVSAPDGVGVGDGVGQDSRTQRMSLRRLLRSVTKSTVVQSITLSFTAPS